MSSGQPNGRSRFISLAAMSALVVIMGMLLTFGLPWILPAETTPAAASRPGQLPAGTLAPALPIDLDTPTPTPRPPPKVYHVPLDAAGTLSEDVRVTSEDGRAVLSLATGTRVTDAQGQSLSFVMDVQGRALSSITVTARRLPLRTDAAWVGLAYDFGPAGALLDPPAPLTITYDPRANYPFQVEQADTRMVYMAYLSESQPERPALSSVGRQATSVTATIDRLGTIVLYVEFSRAPYPGH